MSALHPITKLLVANRGEIAVRIIRTCSELGISSVAVFSEPDRSAMHVRMADEAYLIGPASSSESYLVIDRIIEVAKKCDANAIHPGYGFLSENSAFSAACEQAGIIFVGPSSETITAMGDKTAARALMREAGVPMAAGTMDPVKDVESGLAAATEIGYPVLIKAAAGGGGKGMRIVQTAAEFPAAFSTSRSEAKNAFGDERVFIEKYISKPRHIEFQILADMHGNVIHLFERECSIQRRHQKVIEEAPSSVLTPDMREKMGQASIEAARSCGYTGAGTVEFLLDADNNFYFMEMNTRLQVEHPVTEWITGIDLVAAQIRIAEGQPIQWAQKDISMNGHAIECRVYAENPAENFMPEPGKLLRHRSPAGFGIRVDAGVEEGDEVSIHYDPMISKVTSWGATRTEAIDRMVRGLREYEIAGVPTTIAFCQFVMNHEAYRSGEYSTHFVSENYDPADLGAATDTSLIEEALMQVAAVFYGNGIADKSADSRPSDNYASDNYASDNNASGNRSSDGMSLWRKNRPGREW